LGHIQQPAQHANWRPLRIPGDLPQNQKDVYLDKDEEDDPSVVHSMFHMPTSKTGKGQVPRTPAAAAYTGRSLASYSRGLHRRTPNFPPFQLHFGHCQ
jgi:hypothetical protein